MYVKNGQNNLRYKKVTLFGKYGQNS